MFPYPVGLFFHMLMILLLLFLLIPTGGMYARFSMYFLYFPIRHPGLAYPFRSPRPSFSTGGRPATGPLYRPPQSALTARCFIPRLVCDGLAIGSHRHSRHPLTLSRDFPLPRVPSLPLDSSRLQDLGSHPICAAASPTASSSLSSPMGPTSSSQL